MSKLAALVAIPIALFALKTFTKQISDTKPTVVTPTPVPKVIVTPATATVDSLDMTGFNDIQIAIKPSNGGNFAIEAVMGPDTNSYANLAPVDAAATLQGAYVYPGAANDFEILFSDSAQSLTVDVWNIFMIKGILFDQKLLQFKITNNTGGDSDIEVAFMRLV